MALKIAAFYGSARENRQGIKGARFVVNKLKEKGLEVEFIDILEYDLPIMRKMYKSYDPPESAPEQVRELSKIIDEADGFVFVTGEYNHSIPPGLKNLIDHFQREYFFKPAGIASYSGGYFGGVRSAVHLRQILGELGMVTLPTLFPMPFVYKSFDEDGNALDEKYHKFIAQFIDELEWYTKALKEARKNGTPY